MSRVCNPFFIIMAIIEVRDLHFSYREDIEAVKGVSFSIEKGSYTTILGHNGSGKSTIAKLIAGLLEAKSGDIYIDGQRLNIETIGDIRKKLGIVVPHPDTLFLASSVREDIAFGLENYCVDPLKMDDIINRYAELVGMKENLDKEPSNLSGGQKQRVAIAGILAMHPSIVIFDEATSMLDPTGKEEIKKIIYDLHGDDKLTILSITHDIEEALKSDHIIVMNEGKVYKTGKPHTIFNDAKGLRAIGLDIPFTYKVKEAMQKEGIDIPYTDTIEELAEVLWSDLKA